jgi:hypothetical protein
VSNSQWDSVFCGCIELVQFFLFVKNIGNKLLENKTDVTFSMELEKKATDIYKMFFPGLSNFKMEGKTLKITKYLAIKQLHELIQM